MHWGFIQAMPARRPVRQRVRRSYGGRNSPGLTGKCTSLRSIPAGIQDRTPHIHFKVFIDNSNVITGLPEPITKQVYATTLPYRDRKEERDTFNANDFIYIWQGGPDTMVALKEKDGSYLASLVIGIQRNP
jgi:hypothetical protein